MPVQAVRTTVPESCQSLDPFMSVSMSSVKHGQHCAVTEVKSVGFLMWFCMSG